MRKQYTQMSLLDTYADVSTAMEEDKPRFIRLLEEHINFEELIPSEFYMVFNHGFGRPRKYRLESFIKFFVLQKILSISNDSVLLNILNMCRELRDFCGFHKVPDASIITRFRQDFTHYLKKMFDHMVEVTEPICREIDPKKADYLIYDPTGIEANVAENNPKFFNAKLNQAKKAAKSKPNLNPYSLSYSLMPETAQANPFVKQQYINGHFCYAHKAGILTNGLGVVRDIVFFDELFRLRHPEVVSKKTDNPELDKEIADSTSLKSVLTDFFHNHPTFSYKTFLGDSSFDAYYIYSMLRHDFKFDRMAIPLRNRDVSDKHSDYDENGIPLCHVDHTPFTYVGVCRGKNRSERFKWACPKTERIPGSSKRRCFCETPCSNSSYGRCVYTYPNKNLRLYPGIPRGTEHWDNLYRHRVLIERTIGLLKDPLGVVYRKSYSQRTAKADLIFAGITQLIGVILAQAINKPHLYKSIRKLIVA